MRSDENGKQISVVFETATPVNTPRLMTELVTWFTEQRTAALLHPLLLIGLWVVVLLEVHPFQDGNGRLSRVLTTLLLLQAGYAYLTYSSLEIVVEQSKEAYYLALHQTQGTIRTEAPNWQPWLLFFLRALAEQARRRNRKIEREPMKTTYFDDDDTLVIHLSDKPIVREVSQDWHTHVSYAADGTLVETVILDASKIGAWPLSIEHRQAA